MSFFKAVNDLNQPNDSISRYLSSVSNDMPWTMARSLVENAATRYLRPALGADFYDELETAYANYPANPLVGKTETLIRKLQRSLAYYFAFLAAQETLTQVAVIGPQERSSTEKNSLMPRLWVQRSTIRYHFEEGGEHLDQALEYLERWQDDPAFSTWKSGSGYTLTVGAIFNNANELGQYLHSATSRVVFQRVRPYILEAEHRYLVPVMGKATYDSLKEKIATDSPTPLTGVWGELLTHGRRAISKWAMVCALPSLRLQLTEQGLVEIASNSLTQSRTASEESIRSMWVTSQDAGSIFLAELETFLNQNAASFPDREVPQQRETIGHDTGQIATF